MFGSGTWSVVFGTKGCVRMTNLLDMEARRAQWEAEKPGFGNGLRLFENDVALGHFVATGSDGDAFIKVYKSHAFPGISQKTGKRFWNYRYCTRENDGTECVFCAAGHAELKERMSMWFYLYCILHATPPQEKPNLPQTQWEGRIYYQEEVQGFKRWDDSAWSQSPWADILQLYQSYQTLHAFLFSLKVTGREMQKRFKIFAIPNSAPLPPEVYQRAINECTPIPQTLRAEQQQAVQTNPQQAGAIGLPPAGFASPFQMPGAPSPAPLAIPGATVVAPIPDLGLPGAVVPTPLPIPAGAPPAAPIQAPAPAAPVYPAPPAPAAPQPVYAASPVQPTFAPPPPQMAAPTPPVVSPQPVAATQAPAAAPVYAAPPPAPAAIEAPAQAEQPRRVF